MTQFESDHFAATPGSGGGRPSEASRQFAACVTSHGNRVVLSGIGGDEVTGGVPTPTPELADLLARAQFRTLAHQLKVWALNKRKPWFHLLFEAARGFFPPALVGVPKYKRPPAILNRSFVKRNRSALSGYRSMVKLFGALPSYQENISTLDALRRQLGSDAPPLGLVYERRYPYLDRSLLEFLFSIPTEQLLRPHQRRSLVRRALVGVVPDDLLNRKRKAFVSRGPILALTVDWPMLVEMSERMVSTVLGIVDPITFSTTLQNARNGLGMSMVPVMRSLGIEMWLRKLDHSGVLRKSDPEGTSTTVQLVRSKYFLCFK
jgi:asparagine synthase (glutamine-hydrolysing)